MSICLFDVSVEPNVTTNLIDPWVKVTVQGVGGLGHLVIQFTSGMDFHTVAIGAQ